jgi:hypothetical protein
MKFDLFIPFFLLNITYRNLYNMVKSKKFLAIWCFCLKPARHLPARALQWQAGREPLVAELL